MVPEFLSDFRTKGLQFTYYVKYFGSIKSCVSVPKESKMAITSEMNVIAWDSGIKFCKKFTDH